MDLPRAPCLLKMLEAQLCPQTSLIGTLPYTNVAPENRPSQKETHLPTLVFQVRTVSFSEGNPKKSLQAAKSGIGTKDKGLGSGSAGVGGSTWCCNLYNAVFIGHLHGFFFLSHAGFFELVGLYIYISIYVYLYYIWKDRYTLRIKSYPLLFLCETNLEIST